jgi:phospholipase/carboxylesterase
MTLTRRELVVAAGAVVASRAAGASGFFAARPAHLITATASSQEQPDVRPAPAVFGPGRHALNLERDRDGLVYLPASYRADVPAPLMIVLHGAGGSSESAVSTFPLADELGFIVLATDSRDWTWDSIIHGFGPDVEFLQRAFVFVSGRCAVDRRRLAMTGFSDGASYALSLGIGNGDVFGHILAFSPGVMQPAAAAGKPRIFISHGTADQTMPIDDTSRKFVPRLKALGYEVVYREFDGKHVLPPEIRREAYEWFLEGSRHA